MKLLKNERIKSIFSISVEEILKVLALVTMLLIIIGILAPSIVFPTLKDIHGGYTTIDYIKYFIYFSIRGGSLLIIWFIFWPSIFYYIAKKKSNKKVLKVLSILVGLALAFIVFNWVDVTSLQVNFYAIDTIYELPKEDCGDVIDFYYSPYCETCEKLMPIVESFEKEFDIKINKWCEPSDLNENDTCVEEYGLERSQIALQKKTNNNIYVFPSFIFRCKYMTKGGNLYLNNTSFERVLCTLFDFKEKCEGIEKLPIYR